MRKKRILFCGEATFLNTGYATYNREILTYLHSTGKYELAELSAYGELNDARGDSIPWKFYGAMPNINSEPKSSQEEINDYGSKATNQFGEWAFERVCLDFLPDVVCDIRRSPSSQTMDKHIPICRCVFDILRLGRWHIRRSVWRKD